MRDYQEIAERFVQIRVSWRIGVDAAKRGYVDAATSERTAAYEREMETLAWVLGVDPDTDAARLQARGLLAQIDRPERVRLSAVRSYPVWWWLVEFPADSDPQFKTGYWAAFLSPRQLRQLGEAISARFGSLGGRRLLSAAVPRVIPAPPLVPPIPPDVAYRGLAEDPDQPGQPSQGG